MAFTSPISILQDTTVHERPSGEYPGLEGFYSDSSIPYSYGCAMEKRGALTRMGIVYG